MFALAIFVAMVVGIYLLSRGAPATPGAMPGFYRFVQNLYHDFEGSFAGRVIWWSTVFAFACWLIGVPMGLVFSHFNEEVGRDWILEALMAGYMILLVLCSSAKILLSTIGLLDPTARIPAMAERLREHYLKVMAIALITGWLFVVVGPHLGYGAVLFGVFAGLMLMQASIMSPLPSIWPRKINIWLGVPTLLYIIGLGLSIYPNHYNLPGFRKAYASLGNTAKTECEIRRTYIQEKLESLNADLKKHLKAEVHLPEAQQELTNENKASIAKFAKALDDLSTSCAQSRPDKPQTTSAPPQPTQRAQPSGPTTVQRQQPAVQPPPVVNTVEVARQRCETLANVYKAGFLRKSEEMARYRANDDNSTRLQQEYFSYRARWQEQKRQCQQSVAGWVPSFGNEVEELAMKVDCDARANNYRARFTHMDPLSTQGREAYLASNGEPPLQEFLNNFGQLKIKCSRAVTGWVGYDSRRFMRQAVATR